MAIKMVSGEMRSVENVRMVSVHEKKAQIVVDGRTHHVKEDGHEILFSFSVAYTMYTTKSGERFGFTTDEVCRAIMQR